MNLINSRPIPRSHAVYTIAIIGFIYVLHTVIPMYSNSSFLSLFADEQTVGYIYMMGAAISIFGFLIIPSIIRRLGNYSVALWLILIQMCLFYGLLSSTSPFLITLFFVLQTAVISLIGLNLDIFLEVYTDATNVGTTRGLYNTALNASWVIAPLIGSMLVNGTENYHNTYVAGLFMLIPLFYLVYRNFPRFKDPTYHHYSPWQLIKHISKNKNWDKLFAANLVLQTFYAWMVVYSPIYLNKVIGFGWDEIGIILVVMLIPFAIIQFPLGRLADKKYGEKEMMIAGFIIMGISTIGLSFLHTNNIAFWAIALLITRVGAATAEIMMETYFFKTVSPRDAAALGIFRITRPLSYFTGPLIGIISLSFVTDQSYMFIVVGVVCLLALIPIATIKDTK
ncbi:MAG: MFS transporter [Candidatus Pacebacteria bacterium]|nr:MFS transporter [Candidatus Paceibacterota bacterium]